MKKTNVKLLVQSALIAAVYTAATYIAAALNLAYGQVQFRFSEAMNVLALFTPAAIPGLTVGCLLANIGSPYGVLDMLLGTLATLLSALCIYFVARKLKKGAPYLAAVFPTLFNALIIGVEIAAFLPSGERWMGFFTSAWQVGLGEAAVCFLLGVPLYYLLVKTRIGNALLKQVL